MVGSAKKVKIRAIRGRYIFLITVERKNKIKIVEQGSIKIIVLRADEARRA
jgi:hypothetical protein